MDKEKRKISCTFTGHRPEKLDADEEHVIEWLKKEMHDQYEYIDWFVCECEYGKDPKRLYIPDEETKITNIYLVDNPAMVFDIITNPNFGRENTVTVENVRKYNYAFVHNNEEKTYVVLGLRDSNDGNKCIVLLEDTFNELVYTQRQSGRFVLDGEPDDSDKFIEQLTNQIFLDNDKKNS